MIIEILKITGIPEKGLIFWFKVSENVLEISVGMLISTSRNFHRFVFHNLDFYVTALLGTKPLFEIDAVLSTPEIVLKPTQSEIYNIVVHSVKDFLER